MTIAQYAPTITRGSSRRLLLGSLALNLFFVGVAVAMAIRAPAPPAWDRNVFVRVEHIADTLPPADADLLRGQINANRQLIDEAQTKYHSAQDAIHEALRHEMGLEETPRLVCFEVFRKARGLLQRRGEQGSVNAERAGLRRMGGQRGGAAPEGAEGGGMVIRGPAGQVGEGEGFETGGGRRLVHRRRE